MHVTTKLILAALGVMVGCSAVAHDEALESGWCRGGNVTVLGEFSLKDPLLRQFKADSAQVCGQLKAAVTLMMMITPLPGAQQRGYVVLLVNGNWHMLLMGMMALFGLYFIPQLYLRIMKLIIIHCTNWHRASSFPVVIAVCLQCANSRDRISNFIVNFDKNCYLFGSESKGS